MQNQSTLSFSPFSPQSFAHSGRPRAWHRLAGLCAGLAALIAGSAAQAQSPSTVKAADAQPLEATELAYGLRQPWAFAPLPGGDFLVTERLGSMRVVDAFGRVGPALQGLPKVASQGQGGLLDLVLDRDFANNRRLFFCFSEPDPAHPNRSSTALASAALSERADRLENVQVLFHQMPRVRSDRHFGCRIAQAEDGSLFLTLGDRSIAPEQAQRASNHIGAIVRVQPDGKPHPENPFFRKSGGQAEVWSWGHRNPQGLALTRDGQLWSHELGPKGGDELNLIRAGGNYGWPLETFGSDPHVGQMRARKPRTTAPVHYWKEAIAPSGLVHLDSERYGPQWQGSLIAGSLQTGALVRLRMQDDAVQEEAWFTLGKGQRVRDVREGPDGLLYVLTDGQNGRLLRVDPPPAVNEQASAYPETDAGESTPEPGRSTRTRDGNYQPAAGESNAYGPPAPAAAAASAETTDAAEDKADEDKTDERKADERKAEATEEAGEATDAVSTPAGSEAKPESSAESKAEPGSEAETSSETPSDAERKPS